MHRYQNTIATYVVAVLSIALVASPAFAQSASASDSDIDASAAPDTSFFADNVVQALRPEPVPNHWTCNVLKTEDQLRGLHANNLWPNNTVYYAFHANTSPSQQADALAAMETCARSEEHTSELQSDRKSVV